MEPIGGSAYAPGGGGEDDLAVAARGHAPVGAPGDEEGAVEVDREGPVPVRRAQLGHRHDGTGDAGVGEGHVGTPAPPVTVSKRASTWSSSDTSHSMGWRRAPSFSAAADVAASPSLLTSAP